jgi:hypothetical protein
MSDDQKVLTPEEQLAADLAQLEGEVTGEAKAGEFAATEEANKAAEQANTEELNAAPSANTVFIVRVVDVHAGLPTDFRFQTMTAAIDAYKKVVAQARVDQPFVVLDDYNWLATIKFKAGKVRVVAISNGEKVYGHTGGMRKREAEKQAGFTVPPMA